MRKTYGILLLLAFCLPALAQHAGPFSLSSTTGPNSCATLQIDFAHTSTVRIDVSGTFSATLTPQTIQAGQTARPIQVYPANSTTAQATITAVGGYVTAPPGVAGADTFQVCVTTWVSGTATVYLTPSTGTAGFSSGGGGGGSGTVTSVATGAGLTGGPITTSGTISTAAGVPLYASVTMTAAQINLTAGVPVTIVPAQGSGTVIVPLSVTYGYHYGSAPFTIPSPIAPNFDLFWGDGSSVAVGTAIGTGAGLLDQTADTILISGLTSTTGIVSASPALTNTAIVFADPGGATTGGTGSTVTVNVIYSVITP